MSDSQFQPAEYQGLEPATASAPAPAFGDVQTQPDQIQTQPDGPIDTLPVPIRPPCSNGDCGNLTEHPSELDWQRLMSAVPVEDQLYRLRPRVEGMSYPTEADFRAAVAAVRPEHADEHSLARLRTGWNDEVADKLGDWSERIKSNLTDLSEGWSGTDFEAFEQVCAETRELVDDILDDIDTTVAGLQSTEESIYTLQGGDSGEIPYPAPQFWIEGEWHSWVSVHIRPAWWHGDCISYTCQDAEHVLALAGADPELATEIIDYIDERVEHYIEYYESPVNIERDGLDPKGITVDEAKELAVADANEHYGSVVEQNRREYDARHEHVDEEIGQRSADNESEQQSMRTTSSDKPYPAVADESHMDLEPPTMEQPAGTASPESTQDPSLEPPSGRVPGEDEPWKDSGDDGGESGGLASGGPGGIASGSVASAPSGAGSTTGAAPTGSVSGGATAGGAAGGAAAAAGSGGRGMTGMMGGAGAGGRGMPADDQERDPDVDLVEDENMWGFVNEDEDPYA
ncbi:hypothetical protein GCM10027447_03800 [Glycomyces halotolerans]